MVDQDLVSKQNAALKTMRDEALREGASPFIIRLADSLIALTNLDGADDVPVFTAQFSTEEVLAEKTSTPGDCKHPALNPFGVCQLCRTCTHQFVSSAGTCNTCGETVS